MDDLHVWRVQGGNFEDYSHGGRLGAPHVSRTVEASSSVILCYQDEGAIDTTEAKGDKMTRYDHFIYLVDLKSPGLFSLLH